MKVCKVLAGIALVGSMAACAATEEPNSEISAAPLLSDGDNPILVEQGPHLAVTFHPELSTDRRVHQLFLAKVGGPVKVRA